MPLNGDIHNQGLVDWNPSLQSGTTGAYVNNGKIGKALSTGGVIMPAFVSKQVLNNQAFSYTCWIYPKVTSSPSTERAMIFGNNDPRHFSMFQYPTANDFHWSWYYNHNGTSTYCAGGVLTGVLPSNTWTHIAITYNNPNGRVYINGELKSSFTGAYNNDTFEIDTPLIYNSPYHLLNDVRIYDHTLSIREVKEIAKGLVCHYTLAKNGGDNLITGYDTSFATIPNGATTLFTNQMNGGAQEVVSNIGGAEKCLHLHSNGAQSRQYRTLGAQTGKIYTVSADYYSTTSQPTALRLELNGGNYSWFGIDSVVYDTQGEWRRVSCTTPSLTSDATLYYFFYCNANQDCYIKNIKIEENSIPTPWTPNQSDSLYAKLGFNDAIEYDISGYGHNGTKVGTISYDTDSPKYWTSTYLASGANYINCGRGGMVTDAITVNIWFNATTMYNPISCTEGGGWNFENGGNIQFPIYISGVGYVVAKSPNVTWASLQNSGWHMVTGTYDRTNVKLYIDGVLNATIAASSGNDISYHGGNCIFIGAEAGGTTTPASTNFVGSVSDARIYATALSADDIKELYDTPISLASNSTLMTHGEYTEV